jgi:hypothetical protein
MYMSMPEDKAVKAFVEASQNMTFSPYSFANKIKIAGGIPAGALHKVAIGWFRLSEIDYSYGVGDPIVGAMSARIVHEVLNDYEELPDYNNMRGFEGNGAGQRTTWDGYQPSVAPSFIQRGSDR